MNNMFALFPPTSFQTLIQVCVPLHNGGNYHIRSPDLDCYRKRYFFSTDIQERLKSVAD